MPNFTNLFNKRVQRIQHYLGLASSLALKHSSFSPCSVLHVSCNLKVLTLLHCLLTSCYKSVLTSKVLTFFVFMNSLKKKKKKSLDDVFCHTVS